MQEIKQEKKVSISQIKKSVENIDNKIFENSQKQIQTSSQFLYPQNEGAGKNKLIQPKPEHITDSHHMQSNKIYYEGEDREHKDDQMKRKRSHERYQKYESRGNPNTTERSNRHHYEKDRRKESPSRQRNHEYNEKHYKYKDRKYEIDQKKYDHKGYRDRRRQSSSSRFRRHEKKYKDEKKGKYNDNYEDLKFKDKKYYQKELEEKAEQEKKIKMQRLLKARIAASTINTDLEMEEAMKKYESKIKQYQQEVLKDNLVNKIDNNEQPTFIDKDDIQMDEIPDQILNIAIQNQEAQINKEKLSLLKHNIEKQEKLMETVLQSTLQKNEQNKQIKKSVFGERKEQNIEIKIQQQKKLKPSIFQKKQQKPQMNENILKDDRKIKEQKQDEIDPLDEYFQQIDQDIAFQTNEEFIDQNIQITQQKHDFNQDQTSQIIQSWQFLFLILCKMLRKMIFCYFKWKSLS